VRQVAIRTADILADDFVFPGDNDLVVDTDAMTAPWQTGLADDHLYKFAESDSVHHTIYFGQQKTIEFIARSLRI
jgi:hypothetical protein